MFYLVPRFALFCFIAFGLILVWRMVRQRYFGRHKSPTVRGASSFPLVPAPILRGADRTWVVFTTPDCQPCLAIAERLRRAEPASQVSEIDTRREPRLAEAFHIDRLPAVLLANRYGEVEARLVGQAAVDAALG